MSEGRHASFVIRVVQDRRGQISGVIERVATGAKEAFTSKEVIGGVIARMLQREKALPRTNPRPPPDDGEKSIEPS